VIATNDTLRITLISGDPKEFAKRLHRGIKEFI
jgi:hypothetical protein